jgi:transposase InsO family protein
MASTSAELCADTFVSGWVAHYGMPGTVTTDQGAQFKSAKWQCLACKLGFKHVTTRAYHPKANRMVKRQHRQIKDSLRARGCGSA